MHCIKLCTPNTQLKTYKNLLYNYGAIEYSMFQKVRYSLSYGFMGSTMAVSAEQFKRVVAEC